MPSSPRCGATATSSRHAPALRSQDASADATAPRSRRARWGPSALRAGALRQNAVEDALEDTLAFYNRHARATLYDHAPLRAQLVPFRARLDRRDAYLRLAGGLRRRILLKLYSCAVAPAPARPAPAETRSHRLPS
jgi:hypothetical protein